MASLAQKIEQLSTHRQMRAAYVRWLLARLTTGKPPLLNVVANVRIGGWINFSEYWSMQDVLPEPEQLFIRRCLEGKPGPVVAFDVGANIGAFTCLLAGLGAGQVHAFEPIPETFCRLKVNVMANDLLDRCVLNCLAVGKQTELVSFQVQTKSPATNKLAPSGGGIPDGSVPGLQHVAATSLDVYCQSFGVDQIDFLKVDVEGMEPWVLAGAQRMLAEQRIKEVLIEICPANLLAVGLSAADLYHEFETARYSPFALHDNGRPGAKLSLAEIEAMSLANVVLLPDV